MSGVLAPPGPQLQGGPGGADLAWSGSRILTPYQQGWVDLLGQYEWPCFFTGTYSDEKLQKRYGKRAEYVMRSPTSVLNDFERFKYGTTIRGRHFVAAEPTWYRGVYHLHGLMDAPPELFRSMWREWFRTRGSCRFETPKDGVSVTGYVSKYVLKQLDPDDYRFQFSRRDGCRR